MWLQCVAAKPHPTTQHWATAIQFGGRTQLDHVALAYTTRDVLLKDKHGPQCVLDAELQTAASENVFRRRSVLSDPLVEGLNRLLERATSTSK